jgi:phosphatidylglycerophosphate synthase
MGSFRERYDRMKDKAGEDWWSIVFGYPVGRLLLCGLADIPWITPMGITWFGFVMKLVAAVFLAVDGLPAREAVAVTALLLTALADAMDGTLARYRGTTSSRGAFVDKVSDALGFYLLMVGLAFNGFERTGDAVLLILGPAAGAGYLTICYAYWLYRYALKSAARAPAAPATPEPPPKRRGFWAVQVRILYLGEGDFYFWIALAVVLDVPEYAIWMLGTLVPLKAVLRFVQRLIQVGALDRAPQQEKLN